MSRWVNYIKSKFNIFNKNIAYKRNKKSGKAEKIEVARINDGSFYSQRLAVYVSSKKRILANMGVQRAQIQKLVQITPIALACAKAQQGQVVSLNAAKEIRDFIRKNRDLLIDILGPQGKSKKSVVQGIKFVDFMEKRIDKSIKSQHQPKNELDYNPGIVQRVDTILLPRVLFGSKPIILDRVFLTTLADLETIYARSILGKKYSAFFEKDKLAATEAFGTGTEVIM